MNTHRGYTLIELIVAVGLFALVMTLSSGAYLLMIGINRQAQSIATGINNLSFALETMTRTIRTGTGYSGSGSSFSVASEKGIMSYALSSGTITQNNIELTDQSVTVNSLNFDVSGTAPATSGEYTQPRVTITVSGTVSYGKGSKSFSIKTGATMRGSDL